MLFLKCFGLICASFLLASCGTPSNSGIWATAWMASPTETAPADQSFVGRTVQQRFTVTASGNAARLRLSNVDQNTTFKVSSISINGKPVTATGESTIRIPPQSSILTDPVTIDLYAGEKVEVLMFLPQQELQPTIHWYGRETAYVSEIGDYTVTGSFETHHETDFRIVISALDIAASIETVSIVAIGDSITDGSSAPVGKDMRWPDIAWRELKRQGYNVSMANAGIGGDRLIRDAGHTGTSQGVLHRLEQDVLNLDGRLVVVVAAGLNDIAWPAATLRGKELAPADQAPTTKELIAAYKTIASKVHHKGFRVAIATITPFAGANSNLEKFHSRDKELVRVELNEWIRKSELFDAILDFDLVLRDASAIDQLSTQFDSGDHIHPNEQGFRAMGLYAAEQLAPLIAE